MPGFSRTVAIFGPTVAASLERMNRRFVSWHRERPPIVYGNMVKFLLWLILLVVCWPLALLALLLYPIVWILLLPFRLLGVVVDGVFEFLSAIIRLPARALGGSRS